MGTGAAVRGSWLSGSDSLTGTADGGLAAGPRPVLGGHCCGGDDQEDAATEAGVSSPVGFRWFRHAGGVNPQLSETVSGRYLSSDERENIALWRAQGAGVREIARRLRRATSTISRELRSNASTRSYQLDYKASTAQWHAERRARRPKTAKLVTNDRLRQYVQDKLSGVVRGRGLPGRDRPRQHAVEGPQQTAPW